MPRPSSFPNLGDDAEHLDPLTALFHTFFPYYLPFADASSVARDFPPELSFLLNVPLCPLRSSVLNRFLIEPSMAVFSPFLKASVL